MDKSSSRSTRLVPNKNDIKMESRDWLQKQVKIVNTS
jgi:hypothetical protein